MTSISHMSAVTLSFPRLVDYHSRNLFLQLDMKPRTAKFTRIPLQKLKDGA